MAQGHPDSCHRVTREGPVEPAALARWLERRGSSLRHPACTASEDSGVADENLEGIRQYDSTDTGHSDNVNIAAEHQEPAEVLVQLDNTSNSPVYGEYKCC